MASAAAASADVWIICPGDMIAPEAGLLRGHGTYGATDPAATDSGSASEALYSSLAGQVERINRLVTVKTISGRYVGEVGDVVVGRIKEVRGRGAGDL
jgi:exosome complex component RRP4